MFPKDVPHFITYSLTILSFILPGYGFLYYTGNLIYQSEVELILLCILYSFPCFIISGASFMSFIGEGDDDLIDLAIISISTLVGFFLVLFTTILFDLGQYFLPLIYISPFIVFLFVYIFNK